MSNYPDKISNIDELNELLSEPTQEVIDFMSRLKGDIMFLGVTGKIGPSMARMVVRACKAAGVEKKITGVSAFWPEGSLEEIEDMGIEAIQGDLLDHAFLDSLPDVENVFYLVGMKFGAEDNLSMTWAVNTLLPAMVVERFKDSKIVAFSTGCVYELVPVKDGGSLETDMPRPVGEYAQSCLGRERMFEYGSKKNGTKISLIRLNYAVEMRYGVLVDVAVKVKNEQPVDLSMGYFNVIWQGDANNMIIRSLEQCGSPAEILNITGDELISLRETAEKFGKLFNKKVTFTGKEAETALLNNAAKSYDLFGKPKANSDQMIAWIADWIGKDGETSGKPTKFQVRDGKY